jgi:hypothetical protein
MEIFNLATAIRTAILNTANLIIYLMLGCLIFATSAYATKIQPYDLYYTADIGGMKVEARHQLQKSEGQYRVKTQVKNFLGKVTEQGIFELSKSGHIIPLEYTKHQKTLMGNRSETQIFDWPAKSLLHKEKKTQGKVPISPGQFDRLSLTQQMRLDLARGSKKFNYTLTRKGEFKQYQYQVVTTEIINIGKGDYNSLLVERLEKDSTKKTRIWFALDWDYVILKMETFEKKSKKIMALNHGMLNGNSILPIKNRVEI